MDETGDSNAEIWLDDEGIIHFRAMGIRSTAASVERNFRFAHKLAGGTPVPFLFHAENWPSGDAMSWRRFIDVIESVSSAVAVIMPEADRPKMGRFPELLDALVVPFRMFTEEDDAMAFLRVHNQ